MAERPSGPGDASLGARLLRRDKALLGASLGLQLFLAAFLGHAYDMRIFMATGYLVGTGQNPYLAQDLTSVFHSPGFQGITSFGYPPPWALLTGLIYWFTYRLVPNFLLYNFALKLPIIAANIGLAYCSAGLLKQLGASAETSRRARIFLLFNPFLLLTSTAWGQFDPLVALLSLVCLYWLSRGKVTGSALLLALAVSLKPTPLALVLVAWIFLAGRPLRDAVRFAAVFAGGLILFCILPFPLFGWDPTPILQHWNAHFAVGGGMAFMTFLEYTTWSDQLPGVWGCAGWLWVPALGLAAFAMRRGVDGFPDLLKKGAALILVFFLTRAWLSETNINLVLPFILILVSSGELDRLALASVWVVPLSFSLINTSLFQLLFPVLPGLMNQLLDLAVKEYIFRYAVRTILVLIWLGLGWRVVWLCFRKFHPAEKNYPPSNSTALTEIPIPSHLP
jgi:hypothetical protein